MNTTASEDITARVQEIYERGEGILRRLEKDRSEADTQDQLIEPVLVALGYPKVNMRRERTDANNRPDRFVWPLALDEMEDSEQTARFLLEEKPLGTDFDTAGASRANTPSRQICRYLEQHRLADDATLGILTDGQFWRIYERHTDAASGQVTARLSREYTLGDPDAADSRRGVFERPEGVRALVARLSASTFIASGQPAPLFPGARHFLSDAVSAARDGKPLKIMEALCGQTLQVFVAPLPETGLIADARQHDWEAGFTVGLGPTYRRTNGAQEPLPGMERRVRLAAVPFRPSDQLDGQQLRKGDIGLCARAFGSRDGPLLLCAYARTSEAADDDRAPLRMRLALHVDGQTSMTPEFDPDMPPPSVLLTVDKVVEILCGPETRRTTASLRKAFDIRPLQQEFYLRIEAWLKARLKGKRAAAHGMAMVRHLIRTLFAWILKEHGLVPRSLFDSAFVRHVLEENGTGSFRYHDEILSHLFHGALNLPRESREQHPVAELQPLFDHTPFLNGSIFARHPSDGTVRLQDTDYWGSDEAQDGLYDILSEFQWTLDEHSAQTNDQALDPELLGALFERLVGQVDRSRTAPRRKPKGTYYTPRDVVAVMVSDALVARMLQDEDLQIREAELRQLFTEDDDGVPDWPESVRRRVYERLRRLTIFDPAVGSGVFLLGVLETLMTAFSKLDPTARSGVERGMLVRTVIRDQLHGGDIQPLAAQIAKLRLFLAIEAAEGVQTGPLPNLEARVVNADALGTVPDPDWRPGAAEQLLEADPEFRQLLGRIIENRTGWFDAHDPAVKNRLLEQDRELRAAFAERVGSPVSDRYRSFVEWAPLELDDSIADTDPRLMFSRNPWPGFDIVVGNPPYGDMKKAETKRSTDRGYRSASAKRSEALFIELALALANPARGIVEFVLPLGVSFRQDFATLRRLVERHSRRIDLRHYDMTPGTIFNTMPSAKTWKNKQRTVLFTAWRGEGGRVRTTGLRRWFEKPNRHERAQCLANRHMIDAHSRQPSSENRLPSSLDRRISDQWLRTPTLATRDLISRLAQQHQSIGDLSVADSGQNLSLGLPQTGYQFLPALPLGVVAPRRESPLYFRSREDQLLALAALNGHVFYSWWLMTDDGFDVNLHTATTFALPDVWLRQGQERDRALVLAEQLVAEIPNCLVSKLNAGTRWYNADLFSGASHLIEQLDRLQIESLGLPLDPLLRDLRAMRASSSWQL